MTIWRLQCTTCRAVFAEAGSSSVLSHQLKAGFKGPLLLPVNSCNNALQHGKTPYALTTI
jgi:hypothetical protein